MDDVACLVFCSHHVMSYVVLFALKQTFFVVLELKASKTWTSMELVFLPLSWMYRAVSWLPTKFALEQGCIIFSIIIVVKKHTTIHKTINFLRLQSQL